MIGRIPEPIPGVEPGRWRVVRVRGVEGSAMDWYVDRENCHGSRWFPTWREAQDYADRMARTVEVTLPRPQRSGNGKIEYDFTEWSGLDYWPWMPEGAMYDRRTGPTYRFGEDGLFIRREHWRPLALALLALEEKEQEKEAA